jgi:diguanylate cyclase (GGDEF)-like protein
LGIFAFDIHESIKEDFVKSLKVQTKMHAHLFSGIVILCFAVLIGFDVVMGWTSTLILFRVIPIVFATCFLIYNKFLSERWEHLFNRVYGLLIFSILISASGTLFKVFQTTPVAPINLFGCAVGLAIAMLACYLFAGVAIINFLWISGLPLGFAIVGILLTQRSSLQIWINLAIPTSIYAVLALLTGEQFFLRTKFFAVTRRSQNQGVLLEELKLNYKGLREENILLVEQLKSNATFDELTAAFNKPAGMELLEKEFYFAQRNSEPMALGFLKINNISWLSREYGQEFANKVIVAVTQIIKETMRKSDLMIRYDVDDFLIVFRQCDAIAAKKVVARAKGRAAGLSSQSDLELSFLAGFADTGKVEFTNAQDMIEVARHEMEAEKLNFEASTAKSASESLGEPVLDNVVANVAATSTNEDAPAILQSIPPPKIENSMAVGGAVDSKIELPQGEAPVFNEASPEMPVDLTLINNEKKSGESAAS